MATGPLERLVGERAALVAWLAARFRGRLSYEDAEDVVAEALPRLAADPDLPADPKVAGSYVRRAVWRDAIDELRHRHGRDLERGGPVSLELAAEQPQPDAEPDGTLAERQERASLQAAASRMLDQLSPTEAKVLRLKFLDETPPDTIAEELGVSRSQYQRRLAAASRHALDALVDAHSGDACPQIRRLIAEAPTRLLDRDQAGRRDAHLDECVHCRAFSLRARGALELLPLPAAGMLERLSTRFGGVLGRGGESLAALRDGSEAVAGAGTALGAGLGAKLAIGCTSAAVAVLCAGPLGVMPRHDRSPAKRTAVTAKHTRASRPKPAAVQPTVTAAPSAAAVSTRPVGQTGARPRATQGTRHAAAKPSAAREFGPEAAKPKTGLATASSSEPRGGEFSPPPPPAPTPSTPSSSSFGTEFTP